MAWRWSFNTLPLTPLLASLLVAVPVFLQAPWVRTAPMQAAFFTAPLLALAVLMERTEHQTWQPMGAMLVGFCGSWLGGTLFWGWCRLHPIWHLPVEAFALPLAIAGLGTRWKWAGAFYLASLLGTAATDGVVALTGLMGLWPEVLAAPLNETPLLLRGAAERAVQPFNLVLISLVGSLLAVISLAMQRRGGPWQVAAATLATTLAVDGFFLVACLVAPQLSGMV